MDNPDNLQSINSKTGLATRAALYLGILAFALVLLLFLSAGQASAADVSADITTDTTWTSGSMYNVTVPITVTANATLTIQNNVTVIFEPGASLTVEGGLIIQGSAALPVVFDSNATAGMYLWNGVLFLEDATGSVEYLTIINATTGLYFQNVTVPFSNVMIQGDGNCGVYYELIEGDWTLAVSDLTVDGDTYGVYVQNGNGSLDMTLQNLDITSTFSGAYLCVGSMTDDLRTLDLSVMDCSFNGGDFGILSYAENGGNALVNGSEFLGQEVYAYVFDSDEGDIDVEIVDSVFDGSSANDVVVYIVEEIDYEFELYGQTYSWNDTYTSGSYWIDLPFAFSYERSEYTSVLFSEDGWLEFNMGQRIYTVGNAELSYHGDQFFGYIIADDNSSVLFNWYATDSENDCSNAFQVKLFATGEFQINLATMDGDDSNDWGLWGWDFDYYLTDMLDISCWEADYTSYLFTPNALSYALAIYVAANVGDINFVLSGNTITSNGGVHVYANDGDMTFEATENSVSKMYNHLDSVILTEAYNGTTDAILVNNTFDYIWSYAVFFRTYSSVGGSDSFEVTGNVFTKTIFGVYAYVYVESDDRDELVNDTLSVVSNFQDNIMTDAYGLGCDVYIHSYDQVNWNVTVEQTFTGNVMTQERFEGSSPFDAPSYLPWMMWAFLTVNDYEDINATSMTIDHIVTMTGNEIEAPVSFEAGIEARNYVYNYMGDVSSTYVMTITDNIITFDSWNSLCVSGLIEANLGTVDSDTSLVIENNQIYGWSYCGIYVDWGASNNYEMALDMNAEIYISVVDNLVDGSYEGIYLGVEYYQYNCVGDWNINLTAHMDQNQLLNVTYGIEAYFDAGVEFSDYYWPYHDEVAVGNMVINYLLTADDNVITSMDGDYSWNSVIYAWNSVIYVEIDYWADVNYNTLFSEANVLVNGAVSVSGNDITQEYGDLRCIGVWHGYGASKTGDMEVNVEMAIDNNVIDTDYYCEYAIELWDSVEMYGHWAMPTDAPNVLADVVWSASGNQITGEPDFGIAMYYWIDIDSPDCTLVQTISIDLSDNTITSGDGGIACIMDHMEDTNGYVQLNGDINIENNVMNTAYGPLIIEDDDWEYTGVYVGQGEMVMADGIYGLNLSFDVLISGNQISGYEVGLNLMGISEMMMSLDDEFIYSIDVNYIVENNFINNTWIAINAYGGNMTMTNNVIEDAWRGIEWDYANGEISNNTITTYRGLELDHPYQLLVQNNLITFEETGIDVWGAYSDSALQIMGNTMTCIETEGGSMASWGTGVEIDDSDNVVVDGNVITNAQYGIYLDDVYNLTISNNQITGCDTGVYLYDSYMCWVESNLVKDGGDGLVVDDYCEDIIIGNNTFADNTGDGAYVYDYYTYDITLYNNEFSGNGDYGLCAEAYDSGVMWYVDADSVVARNDVYYEGQIEIMEGGTMMVEDVDSFVIYSALIQVDEGGLLFMSNSDLYGWGYLEVHGTFWANVCLFEGFDIYLGPTSAAEIRASAIMYYEYAGIHVDGCSPVIADNLIFSPYGMYGILVEGEGASPSIVSNIIAMNEQGVYARDTDMGGIYDNIFLLNTKSGILAENATGNIHDNVFLANKIEILLRNSDVSIEDNEIGYTDLFQVLANYAPLLGHFMSTSGEEAEATSSDPWMMLEMILDITGLDIYDIPSWVKGHNGIWAENSVVETSGNVYGMFNYALYAVGSEIHFADDITMQELLVPHVRDNATVNYSVNIYVLNGIYASGSTLWVDGSTIDVLDDAIVLENSQAWIEGANLMAGDFDYFLFAGSEAYNINTTYSKYKVEDTSMLYEGTWLTLNAEDNGEPSANVTVVVKNAKGEIVFEGVTDENGMVRMLLPQYAWTSSGKDDSFSPYTANATFESGEKSMDLGLNESYMDATISGEKKSDMGAILAVIGVLVIILLIVAAVVVMRRRK